MANDDVILTASQVVKEYRPSRAPALGPVDLHARVGEVLAIVGPSGSGKTTLLQILSGLMRPTAGEVRFRGTPIDGPSTELAMVFQDYGLFPWRTTVRNVEFPLEVAGVDRRSRRSRATQALEMVGMLDARDRYPRQLSGGMMQRAAIARAIVRNPSLLVLDEPMSALDVLTRRTLQIELSGLIREMNMTAILVTHDLLEAVRLADRVLILAGRPGTFVADFAVDRDRPESSLLLELTEVLEYSAANKARSAGIGKAARRQRSGCHGWPNDSLGDPPGRIDAPT